MNDLNKTDSFLEHHGVKGMKWGVRKTAAQTGDGWTIHPDGKIDIEAGATVSRVVRNTKGLFGGTGAALDSGKPIYAAFKPSDVVGYEHFFGRSKSVLVKEASTVLKLTANNKLSSPGPKEAAAIYYDTLKKNPEALSELRDALPVLARRGLDKAIADPTSKRSYGTYSMVLDGANYSSKALSVNQKYFDAVKRAGYNMLLDPSDASMEFDAPIIILDGGKNLSLSSQYVIDKVSANKARLAYKTEAARAGKTYLQKLGYA